MHEFVADAVDPQPLEALDLGEEGRVLFFNNEAIDHKFLERRKPDNGGQRRRDYALVGLVEFKCHGLYVGPAFYGCCQSSNKGLYSRASLFR